MKLSPRVRSVLPIGLRTPIIVPSFSSCAIYDIEQTLDTCKSWLPSAILVSAFDLAHRNPKLELDTIADIVFLDSGGYEVSSIENGTTDSRDASARANWSNSEYRAFLSKLSHRNLLIVVNLDSLKPLPLSEQIQCASEDYRAARGVATDFLIKPGETGLIDMGAISVHIGALRQFNILGVTEEDLGASHLDRCVQIIRLRKLLNKERIDLPIHVFGCITPLAVLAYFLCGADIFDGLNWLRYDYTKPCLGQMEESAIFSGHWSSALSTREQLVWKQNLKALSNLHETLTKYCHNNDSDCLTKILPGATEAFRLAERAVEIAETGGA